ncbi:hypothetical protein [Okeania hirsuta]|uniref:hypothetical protein n=1 Tax=Okeania hirsuta TaxID=1458930 RepID=UPI001374CBB3|nr:hypothetical protein [Okeania hirsuta]
MTIEDFFYVQLNGFDITPPNPPPTPPRRGDSYTGGKLHGDSQRPAAPRLRSPK